MEQKLRLITVKVSDITPSPDNPRVFDEKDPDFPELVESIRAQGVVVPVHVGLVAPCVEKQGTPRYVLLSGERRWRACLACGRQQIDALHHGVLSAEEAFEVTFTENFCRQDLKPIEAGKAVSILLAKHGDDVAAVASRMGQSPHWVQTHAQIDRGLTGDWKKAAVSNKRFIPWSAGHWIEIARLPAPAQERALKHFTGGNCYSADQYSVSDVVGHLNVDKRLLAKACFPTGPCAECPKRTGHQPFLWAEETDKAAGKKDACLDPACWDRKTRKIKQAKFANGADAKGVPEAVPLDMSKYESCQRPDGALKKTFGSKLLRAGEVSIVKKGTAGAVPAIVVAGRGQGALKYVKPKPEDKRGQPASRQSAADRRAAEQQRRCREIIHRVCGEIAALQYGQVKREKVLLVAILTGCSLRCADKQAEAFKTALDKGDKKLAERLHQHIWRCLRESFRRNSEASYVGQYEFKRLRRPAVVFGYDLDALMAELVAAEKAETKAKAKLKKKAAKKPKAGKKRKTVKKAKKAKTIKLAKRKPTAPSAA